MNGWTGIRFMDGGRDHDGLDCWGLVRLYLLEEASLDLPIYGETSAAEVMAVNSVIMKAITSGSWIKVDRSGIQRFDVVLLWSFERADGVPYKTRRHLGVLVDSRHMLHIEHHSGSVIVSLNHPSIRTRLESFWRHIELR